MKTIKYSCGVDIAKDKFDACICAIDANLSNRVVVSKSFANTKSGFKTYQIWLNKYTEDPSVCLSLVEATGIYHEHFAIFLVNQGLPVSVVLPNRSKKFIEALGFKSKNDQSDAKALGLMALSQSFEPFKPIARFYYNLRVLTRFHQSVQESKSAISNQIHALEHSAYDAGIVLKELRSTLKHLEKQLEKTKKRIAEYLSEDATIQRKVDNITKIKGLSTLSIATIIAETAGFELFKSIPQLVSYVGYDVIENQSGKHVGKTKISKKGNPRIRRILHMPALNTVRYKEPILESLFMRVYQSSGVKMKAYVAVQKKLLVLVYALWKNHEEYKPLKQVVPQLSDTTLGLACDYSQV